MCVFFPASTHHFSQFYPPYPRFDTPLSLFDTPTSHFDTPKYAVTLAIKGLRENGIIKDLIGILGLSYWIYSKDMWITTIIVCRY